MKEQFKTQVEELSKQHVQNITQLQQLHRDDLQKLRDECAERQKQLEDLHALRLKEKDDQLEALAGQIAALNEQIANRESRPEDLEKIRTLKALIKDLKEEIRTSEEKMKWYKRELIAREEAYNSRFHRDPVKVGNMPIPGIPADIMQERQPDSLSKSTGRLSRTASQPKGTGGTARLPGIHK